MKALVVFCHPTHESFTGECLRRTVAGLRRAGHATRLIDLYADDFAPELSREGLGLHGLDHRDDPAARHDIAGHIDGLRWADVLVLVYPTWWSGQPAMLTGWFDRVLVRGVAWEVPDGATTIRPLLGNIRRIVAVTNHGSSKLINALEGEGGKRIVTRALRVLCSRRCRATWIALYGIDRSSDDDRRRFLARVERSIAAL